MNRDGFSKPSTSSSKLALSVLDEKLAICRLERDMQIPAWVDESRGFVSITKTSDELSIVCEENIVPSNVKTERGWRALRVNGVLDFSLTGILAAILNPLGAAKISAFAISTYETDYVLVRSEKLDEAIKVLSKSCELKF